MQKIDKCVKCGSGAIAQAGSADVYPTSTQSVRLRVDKSPDAVFLKKSVRSTFHAFVCSSCGYVEFYADDPKALYDAFRAAQQN